MQTHCKRNHEFTEDNTHVYIDKNGGKHKRCRTCAHLLYLEHRDKWPEKFEERNRVALAREMKERAQVPDQTHCKKGHPLPPENIGKSFKQIKRRKCRACEKNAQLKREFGISYEQFEEMLARQDRKCANPGCKTPNPRGQGTFHVDHNHATKKVRGLLCHACNCALGLLRENKSVILGLVQYLDDYEGL